MLTQLGITGLAILAAYKVHQRRKVKPGDTLSPKHEMIFKNAMLSHDAAAIKKVAEGFRKLGFRAESDVLIQRANLRSAPPALKAARRAAFKNALACTDPDAVDKVADAYAKYGATDSAQNLRNHAKALRAAGEIVHANPTASPSDSLSQSQPQAQAQAQSQTQTEAVAIPIVPPPLGPSTTLADPIAAIPVPANPPVQTGPVTDPAIQTGAGQGASA